MGTKNKVIQTPHQNNTTSYVEETPDIAAAREAANQTTNDLLPPALQAQYDRARQKAANRTNSAYNQATPAHLRNAQQNMQERDLLGDQGMALAQGAYNQSQANFARKMGLAEMTARRQQASSGYGSQVVQQQSPWASLAMGGLQAATAFL